MKFSKLLLILLLILLKFTANATEVIVASEKVQVKTNPKPVLTIQDNSFANLADLSLFRSIDPAVYVHLGLLDDSNDLLRHSQVYTCKVTFTVTPYSNLDVAGTPYPIVLEIKHDYKIQNVNFIDNAIYKLPNLHKAKVEVDNVIFTDANSQVIQVNNAAVYTQLTFKTERYYNLKDTYIQSLEATLITYSGNTSTRVQANGVVNAEHELELQWSTNTDNQENPPAESYELEWVWLDNSKENNGELSAEEIPLTEEEFRLNSSRIETRFTNYRIPLIFQKGYLIYRVRPVGRFLDDIDKMYFGAWSSNLSDKLTIDNWPHVIRINSNHEKGMKNWQLQTSYAEDGKKKEVISYFDGTLRNRQTVTRTNTNNKAIVGEVVYDAQGRPAIEVLPAPIDDSALRYYDKQNLNNLGELFTHLDFDWEEQTTITCNPAMPAAMSKTAGSSKYYSDNAINAGNHQDYVPHANGYPFSQIEYTPDNTGRIRRKGGVGYNHQLGSGHEMQYYYANASQPELNRLFGYIVGKHNHYKKNIVADPNGQISISYVDPQGRTVATALAENSPSNLDALDDALSEEVRSKSSLLSSNQKFSTGKHGPLRDGVALSTQIAVLKNNSNLTLKYKAQNSKLYEESCLKEKKYPFVFNYNLSLRDDCGNEKLIGDGSGNTNVDAGNTIWEQTISALAMGTYTLSKTITIDSDKLEVYADDYISTITDSTNVCFVDPKDFAPSVSLENCNVSCSECEGDLIGEYLPANERAVFQAMVKDQNTIEASVIVQRKQYVDKAEQAYIIANMRLKYNNENFGFHNDELYGPNDGSVNPYERDLYENRFRQEFQGLLKGCRSLCGQDSGTQCTVAETHILNDLSPGGQYGSISGLVDTPDGEVDTAVPDPLSIFNTSNYLWFYGHELITDGETENGEASTVVNSFSSWKFPRRPYADEFGYPATILVTKEGEEYNPPISGIPVAAGELAGTFLVKPEQLKNFADFYQFWEPSWAQSLIEYHPEYFYYMYDKALCAAVDNVTGKTSEDFDTNLMGIETFSDGQLLLDNIINQQNNAFVDPYFKISYQNIAGVSHDPDFNNQFGDLRLQRSHIMLEALHTNYDGLIVNGVSLNMLQAAYYIIVYSNGIVSQLDVATAMNSLSNPTTAVQFIAGNTNLSQSQKDKIWQTFRDYYLSLKSKIKGVYRDMYAANNQRYNGCIEDSENTATFITVFQSYSAYNEIYHTINAALTRNFEDNNPNIITDPTGLCSNLTSHYYGSKVKRFKPADFSYNYGAAEGQAVTDLESDTDANLYIQTGKCPLAFDMEYFLDGLVDPTYQPNGLLPQGPFYAYQLPFLTTDLFNAVTDNAAIGNISPQVNGFLSGNELIIKVDNSNIVALTIVSNGNTGCGATPDWTGYNQIFRIIKVQDLYYIPDSYNTITHTYKFKAVAQIIRLSGSCGFPEEIIIEGETIAAVGGCGFDYDPGKTPGGSIISSDSALASGGQGCTQRTRFEKGMVRLINNLVKNGTLQSTEAIQLGMIIQPGYEAGQDIYGYSTSILPQIIKDELRVGGWRREGSNSYQVIVGANASLTMNIDLNLTPQDIVTAVNIDSENTITVTYLHYSSSSMPPQLQTVSGTILGKEGTPLDFSCHCTKTMSRSTAFEKSMLDLMNHVADNRRYYGENPGTYTPQPFMNNFVGLMIPGSGTPDILVEGAYIKSAFCKFGIDYKTDVIPEANISHFSNLRITEVSEDEVRFTFLIHHSQFIQNGQGIPAGFVQSNGFFDYNCFDLQCNEAEYVSNRLLSVFNNLIDHAQVPNFTNGNNPQINSSVNNDLQDLGSYFNFNQSQENLQIQNLFAVDNTRLQIGFSIVKGDQSCEALLNLNNGLINDINEITAITFNSLGDTFVFEYKLVNGESHQGFGSILCLSIPQCLYEVEVPCETCIPKPVEVVACAQGWELYNQVIATTQGSVPPYYMTPDYFCKAKLQYVVADYQYFLSKNNILNVDHPAYISITEFAASGLGYGNVATRDAINMYHNHINSNGIVEWRTYVKNHYLAENDVCPQTTIVPVVEYPIVPEDPCVTFENNVSGTYSKALWLAYLANEREGFIQRYISEAISDLTETLTKEADEKEYQYTLYYYDQAGNLIQTVPPEGVARLSSDVDSAIDALRNGNQENIALLPQHKLQTQYKYNSLNQLIWQKTPDGGITKFAYDDLGRIIASQNERQLTSFYGFPELTLSQNMIIRNNVVHNTNPEIGFEHAYSQPVIKGNGYAEYTVVNSGVIEGSSTNGQIRYGLSYEISTSENIMYSFRTDNNANDSPIRVSVNNQIVQGIDAGIIQDQDVFRVERSNDTIYFKKNNIPFYFVKEAMTDRGKPLRLHIAIRKPGARVRNNIVVDYNNGDVFSYTKYDVLGRITEAGEITSLEGTQTQPKYKINDEGRLTVDGEFKNAFDELDYRKQEVTKTMYDTIPADVASRFTSYSNNSRNRVTGVLYYNQVVPGTVEEQYDNGIFYDYDVHGNVREILHKVNNTQLQGLEQDVKKIIYRYDLISGNVKSVIYQPGKKDQFIHKYEYDADNRIVSVYTSKDDVIWEKEANYLYYDHGPLARVELGDKKVQGLDYIYTLQGWLKSVNGEKIDRNADPGKDGLVVARDAFAFALNYYSGDYVSRHGQANPGMDNNLFYYSRWNGLEGNKNLYNGNIKEMITSLTDENQKYVATQFNKYSYDQLNRITAMNSTATYYDNFGNATSTKNSYRTAYTYDRNGNFKTMNRFGLLPQADGTLSPSEMDRFTYNYSKGTNKLTHIDDLTFAGFSERFSEDIDDQYLYNYEYDPTGQLITDYAEGLRIEWRVDGKVKKVHKNDGTIIAFDYDGLGNRIAKTVTTSSGYATTFYSRDAQGNVISAYKMIKEGDQPLKYRLVERNIYGSSRLGLEECEVDLTEEDVAPQAMMAFRMSVPETQATSVQNEPACLISGLEFTTDTANAQWVDEVSESLNLWDNEFSKTKKFMMASKFKINNAALPTLGKRKVADIQGQQNNYLWISNKWHWLTFRSSVALIVEKDAQGKFVPIVQLEKYYMDSWPGKKSPVDTWHSINQNTYRFPAVASDEWDITVTLKLNHSQKYVPVLVINGNEYKQYTEEPVLYRENQKSSDFLPQTVARSTVGHHSYGYTHNGAHYEEYFNVGNMHMPLPLPALVMEMCEFRYFVEDPMKEKAFPFDNGSTASTILADDEEEIPLVMERNGVDFKCSYCGSDNIDTDNDGIVDRLDNCPKHFNPFQEDTDGDGIGDVCDNCKYSNPLQEDADGDGRGDGGLDANGDYQSCDNCKHTPNYDQADTDGDGVGDVCDNCPSVSNPDQADDDEDGIGNVCEGDDQGQSPALAEAEAESAERHVRLVGDKRYELSNHLGNVLEVITDRKIIGGNSIETSIYSETFDSGTGGWVKYTNPANVMVNENGRLAITSFVNGEGAYLPVNLTAGVSYTFTLDLNKQSPINFGCVLNFGTEALHSSIITTNGRLTFTITAASTGQHRLRVRLSQASYSGPGETIYVDNVRIVALSNTNMSGYVADVISYSDYDPFGMLVTGRHTNSNAYRYGFQGQEMDNELKGEGNSLNYTFRMHDPRVGRFFAVDKLMHKYPWYSPYQFSGNRPIDSNELEGLEPRKPLYLSNKTGWIKPEIGTWDFYTIDNGKWTKIWSSKSIVWEVEYIWGNQEDYYPHLDNRSWLYGANGEIYDVTGMENSYIPSNQIRRLQTMSKLMNDLAVLQTNLNRISENAALAISVIQAVDGVKNLLQGVKAMRAAKAAEQTTRKSIVDKLDTYLLDKNHPVGGSKADYFEKALGFTKSNADDLAKQIKFDASKAVSTGNNGHGVMYEQMISITGANGRKIDVQFNFIIKNGETAPRLVGAIPTKK